MLSWADILDEEEKEILKNTISKIYIKKVNAGFDKEKVELALTKNVNISIYEAELELMFQGEE